MSSLPDLPPHIQYLINSSPPVCRRYLGGKLGQHVMEALGVEMLGQLRAYNLSSLRKTFGDTTG